MCSQNSQDASIPGFLPSPMGQVVLKQVSKSLKSQLPVCWRGSDQTDVTASLCKACWRPLCRTGAHWVSQEATWVTKPGPVLSSENQTPCRLPCSWSWLWDTLWHVRFKLFVGAGVIISKKMCLPDAGTDLREMWSRESSHVPWEPSAWTWNFF